MPKNQSLQRAKSEAYDEFYTRYEDIEREINAYLEYNPNVFRDKTVLLPCDDPEWSNFTKFFAQKFEQLGLKKLISTSYAADSKPKEIPYQPTLFEIESPKYDKKKTRKHGKIFVLERDTNKNQKININDLEWDYLEGDGDFRSAEITKLRDEADIIITNPPFSLFIPFLKWIAEKNKLFIIIGSFYKISVKDVFPLIKENKMWLGNGFYKGNAYFKVPEGYDTGCHVDGVYDSMTKQVKFRNCCWYTNIDHGKRHNPLKLMRMDELVRYSRHADIKNNGYRKYDNFNAIEVKYYDAIPEDYKGIMGMATTFLDKYCPDQFDIVGNEYTFKISKGRCYIDGKRIAPRIFIKHKEQP